jgi:protein ImuA
MNLQASTGFPAINRAFPPPAPLLARQQEMFGTLRNPLLGKHFMNMPAPPRRPASTTVQELKARLASFAARGSSAEGSVGFGIPAIDRHLPWGGIPRGALHEIAGAEADGPAQDGAAGGFAAALLARFAKDAAKGGPVVWIARRPNLTQAGLAAIGLDPARLLLVEAPKRMDALWAFEEALRCRSLAAVAAEIDGVELVQTRRLQLAAELGGTAAFLLRPPAEFAQPSAARTRWRVAGMPADPATPSRRWRVELARLQGGTPGAWTVALDGSQWSLADDEALPRDLPAVPADRSRRKVG